MKKIGEWDIGFFSGVITALLIVYLPVYLSWPWWAEILLGTLIAFTFSRVCQLMLRKLERRNYDDVQ